MTIVFLFIFLAITASAQTKFTIRNGTACKVFTEVVLADQTNPSNTIGLNNYINVYGHWDILVPLNYAPCFVKGDLILDGIVDFISSNPLAICNSTTSVFDTSGCFNSFDGAG